MKKVESFWITNISNRNVSLADLNLTIKAYASINLLDKKRYQYTIDQLELSAKSGSLYKKQRIIAIRNNAPTIIKNNMPVSKTVYDAETKTWSENGTFIPGRERSVLKIEETYYEELDVDGLSQSDEKFAEENADLANLDHERSINHKGK